MGIGLTSYRRLENEGADNCVVSSLEYLSSLAALRNMFLPDFVSFLNLP
ncbi:MAG: hypothetical protein H6618_06365 [Deltaproteobacteria bacterium]|nr:hypothetical protein [Deltaproteobacteria bacterium]